MFVNHDDYALKQYNIPRHGRGELETLQVVRVEPTRVGALVAGNTSDIRTEPRYMVQDPRCCGVRLPVLRCVGVTATYTYDLEIEYPVRDLPPKRRISKSRIVIVDAKKQ